MSFHHCKNTAKDHSEEVFEELVHIEPMLDSKQEEVVKPPIKRKNKLKICADSLYADYIREKAVIKLRKKHVRTHRARKKNEKSYKDLKVNFLLRNYGTYTEYDIPVVINHHVEKWLSYFKGKGRTTLLKWLTRSQHVQKSIEEELRAMHVPSDLFYLALAESGISHFARSKAKATGPWQFIASTGKLYGLKRNYWLDERKDLTKSTRAASMYLKDLYNRFDD